MNTTANEKICPYVKAPLPDCWCADESSQSIENAIYYCGGGHFEECEIYRRNKGASC